MRITGWQTFIAAAIILSTVFFMIMHLSFQQAPHGSVEADAMVISFGLLSAFFWLLGSIAGLIHAYSEGQLLGTLSILSASFNAVGATMTAAAIVFNTKNPSEALGYMLKAFNTF